MKYTTCYPFVFLIMGLGSGLRKRISGFLDSILVVYSSVLNRLAVPLDMFCFFGYDCRSHHI